jgi:hypothetical protein
MDGDLRWADLNLERHPEPLYRLIFIALEIALIISIELRGGLRRAMHSQ